MKKTKLKNKIAIFFMVFLICVVAVQVVAILVFDTSLGFASFCGQRYKLLTKDRLIKDAKRCLSQNVSIRLDLEDKKLDTATSYDKLGVSFDSDELVSKKLGFNYSRLLIPFGGYIFDQDDVISEHAVVNTEKMDSVFGDIADSIYVAPKDAYVEKSTDRVNLHKEVAGLELKSENMKKMILTSLSDSSSTINLETTTVSPKISHAVLDKVAEDITKTINKKYVFEKDGKQVILDDPKTVLDMIDIDNASARYSVNKEKVTEYINKTVAPFYYVSTVDTVESVIDGVVVSRIDGQPGVVLANTAGLADKFIESTLAVDEKQINIAVQTLPLKPKVVRNSSFSKTNIGLSMLLESLRRQYGDVSISVSGLGLTGSVGGNERKVSASTYKLAIAYAVAQRVTNGQLQWADTVINGLNVEQCMEAMIVRSEEKCAQHWLRTYFGVDYMNSLVSGLGMANTSYGDWALSSTNDQLIILKAINGAQGISAESSQKILSYMGRQVYRQGIESGVNGLHVAGKVGFILGYKTESAVVYAPGGPIYISIYSNGRSWGDIAAISRDVINHVK